MTYQEWYSRSIEHPEEFWRDQARKICWFQEPKQILTQDDEGFNRWFQGGKLNTAYLALDRHVEQGRGEQLAVIYDSPVTNSKRTYTYRELRDEVARFAGVLRELGVEQGDTVVIYMPMIPQTIIAMLACARIGAIHSVVFGGFAPRELAVRIDDIRPTLLLTANAGKEVDREIDYLQIVDAAFNEADHAPSKCVVFRRDFSNVKLRPRRDLDWEQLCESANPVDWVALDATDPLYVLYTSGTTGRPKGILRDNGGHAVAMKFSMESVYGTEPGEVFWAASDLGWVVGHSYIVYGPLIHGCTTVLYEGKPVRTPNAGAFWRVAAEHDVRTLFTAPTAIRAIRQEDPNGELLKQYDTSCLRNLFLAGEHCDVATLEWIQRLLQIPVIDHWWQTESGWPMIANMAGVELLPIRPGSAAKPVCGYDIRILDTDGKELPANESGSVAIRLPLPPGCLTNLWHNTSRFRSAYLDEHDGYFASGDGGYKDEQGYVFITGRMDDIINVAGHRLSTATIEEVLAAHLAVAECAVIGISDKLKGQVPIGFVVLNSDVTLSYDTIQADLVRMVREQVGPVASFKRVIVTKRLPKTRSGKLLRRTIRSMAEGEEFTIPATIDDPTVLTELANTMRLEHLTSSSEDTLA